MDGVNTICPAEARDATSLEGMNRMSMIDDASARQARSPDELVELYSDEIWRFVSSQISRREDAEDVVMEVFAAAFARFGQLGRVDNHRLWLLAVARKKVADALRLRYRRAERPLDDLQVAQPAPQVTELQAAARVAIKCLPPPQGDALVLKYVNGLSTEEVAQVIRKSVPATNSLLQRARETLRDALGATFKDYARSQS